MSVINQLASSLGRRDEEPNLELAKTIAANKDKHAVAELVKLLANKNPKVQSDSIKALYEIGTLEPTLISPYVENFIQLLDSKNNRLQWGAMTALNNITSSIPETIYEILPALASIADKGSVITRDNYVAILIRLYAIKKYADPAFLLLNAQLTTCPTNQLPMYAENALGVIAEKHKAQFSITLNSRLSEFEKASKRMRVEKVLKKL